MPWARAYNNPYTYRGLHFINALKQKAVGELVEYAKTNSPAVSAICIFGSAVTEYCRPDSDIDFLVFGEQTDSFRPRVEGEVLDYQWASTVPKQSQLWEDVRREGVVVYAK